MSGYDVRATEAFGEDLELYREVLVKIIKRVEGRKYVKFEGLASVLPFEIAKEGLKPIKVYVNPHKKQILIQYLDEETAIDRLIAKDRQHN